MATKGLLMRCCQGVSLFSLLVGLAVGSASLLAILSMYKNTAQVSAKQSQQSKQNSQQESGVLAAQMELQQAGFNIIQEKLAIFKPGTYTSYATSTAGSSVTVNPDFVVIQNAKLSSQSSTVSGKTTYSYTVSTTDSLSGNTYNLLAADQSATTPTTYTNFAIFWRYNTQTALSSTYDTNPSYECRGLIAQNIGLTLLTPTSTSPTCTSAYDAAQTGNTLQWQATELVSEDPPSNVNWDVSTIKTKIALSVSDSSKGTGACWPFGATNSSTALTDVISQVVSGTASSSVLVPEITIWLNNGYSLYTTDSSSSSATPSMMQSVTTCLPNFANTNTIIPAN